MEMQLHYERGCAILFKMGIGMMEAERNERFGDELQSCQKS